MGFLYNLWTNPGPDSGWSWVVALSSCWIQFEMLWITRFSGFIFTALIQMFGASREEAAVPFAVYAFSLYFPGIFVSMLLQFLSERQIVLAGILIASFGLSMCYFATSILWITLWMGFVSGSCTGICIIPLTVIISHYFVKSRTTANGISLAGNSIGGFIFPPIAFLLLNFYGLSGTFLLMGAIISNSLIAAALLRPRNQLNFPERLTCDDKLEIKHFIDKRVHQDNASENVLESSAEVEVPIDYKLTEASEFLKSKTKPCEPPDFSMTSTHPKSKSVLKRFITFTWNCLKIMKNPVYILTVMSDTFFSFSNVTLLLLLVDYLMDIGFSKEFAVTVLMVQSVFDLLGRIFTGFITDRGYLTRQASIAITFLIYGSTFFFLTVFNQSYLFILNSIMYGLFGGCTLINIQAFYPQYLTKEEMPIGIGLSCTFKGFPFLLQSALIGYFRDQIGNYVPLFYLLSSVAFVFSSLWLILTLNKWKNRNSASVRETDHATKECVLK